MRYAFLMLLAFCFIFVYAQEEEIVEIDLDNELELLPADVFNNEVLLKEIALQGSESLNDSLSKELLNAAVFFYDKKWDSAQYAYSMVLNKVSDYLYGPIVIRIAKCELEMGKIAESRNSLLNIKSAKSNRNYWEEVDAILVEGILKDTLLTQNAKKDSIMLRLKSNPSKNYDKLLKWKLSTLLTSENKAKEAKDIYFALLTETGKYADSAFKMLLSVAPNSTDYNFVKFLCTKKYNERCVEQISLVLSDKKSKLDSAKKINLMVLQAEAWQKLSKTDLAVAQYKKLLDSIDYQSSWMQSLLRIVRNTGNKAEAKRLDSIFQKKFPFRAENANNLWVKALEKEQAKDYENAIETYKKLYNPKFGKNQRRQWAKFRVGFINFKEGKYAAAANIFVDAAGDNLGLMPRSASLYFYAQCQRLLGYKHSARIAYLEVIEDFPLGYYSWRAKQNLKEFELTENIPKLGTQTSDSLAVVWLRNLQKKPTDTKDTIISEQRLEQVSVLLRNGFREDAFNLFNDALKHHKNRPEFYFKYGVMFIQNGEYALAHRMARNFLDMVPRGKLTNVPMQVLKFLYPLPHNAKVKKHAKIDPYFVYSVMRQESMFDAQIQSPAGARGLLQIMPATGTFLAQRENIAGFNKDLLFNAYMNIRLGVRYLNDLYTEHNSDYIGVLGEYNAGPAPVKRWLTNYGTLPWDIRVEEVSYWETRDYVKRVMGNYWTYKEIYE